MRVLNQGDPKKKTKLTYRDPNNTYTPSENMSMEDIKLIMNSQGGFPLGEAVVEDQGGPRIYSREGMSQFAEQGSAYSLEAARLIPFIGEALDLGDIGSAYNTGKDLSGNDATPEGRAAMLGVGLLIPNIIEKPAKWLLKQGARNASDVKRILTSFTQGNASDIPVDLKPILELSKKSDEMKSFLRTSNLGGEVGSDIKVDVLDEFGRVTGKTKNRDTGRQPSDAMVDWMAVNDPDRLLTFSPKNFNSGSFDEAAQEWSDVFLTSYRGVTASSEELAEKYLRNPPPFHGLRTHGGTTSGTGIYSSPQGVKRSGRNVNSPPNALGYADPVLRQSDESGYLGVLRTLPELGGTGSRQSAKSILQDVNLSEKAGQYRPSHYDAGKRQGTEGISSDYGIMTRPNERIARGSTAENAKILNMFSTTGTGGIKNADEVVGDVGSFLGKKYPSDFGQVGNVWTNKGALMTPEETAAYGQSGMNELYEAISRYNKGGRIKTY